MNGATNDTHFAYHPAIDNTGSNGDYHDDNDFPMPFLARGSTNAAASNLASSPHNSWMGMQSNAEEDLIGEDLIE